MFKQILHTFRRKKCLKSATWERGELHCTCGEILALRYTIGDLTRVFVYPEYVQFKKEIMESQALVSGDEVVGAICFDDFSAFIEEMKKTPFNTYVSEEECMTDECKEDTYLGESIPESKKGADLD